MRELERASGVSIGYRRSGVLKAAYGNAELSQLSRGNAWQARAGLPFSRLSRKALRAREPALSPELAGALWFERDATLDPRSLLSALRVAAEKAGASFRSGSFVKRVAEHEGRAIASSRRRSVGRGSHVVLAAGSWTSWSRGPRADTTRLYRSWKIVELSELP